MMSWPSKKTKRRDDRESGNRQKRRGREGCDKEGEGEGTTEGRHVHRREGVRVEDCLRAELGDIKIKNSPYDTGRERLAYLERLSFCGAC